MSNPQASSRDRSAEWVWLILVGLTLVTFFVGLSGAGGLAVSLGVLFAALFKGWLVGENFMGLKWVRGWWRWVIFIWLFIPGALITTAFYLSSS